jgi:hypothetical protein
MATDMARNKTEYSAHNERVLWDKEHIKEAFNGLGRFHLMPQCFFCCKELIRYELVTTDDR